MKRRQPFTYLNRPEEPKTKTEGTDDKPEANTPIFAAAFEAEFELPKAKKCCGGHRKFLKRLNSAKESEHFDLDFVPADLEFVPPGLDFVPFGLDFLPPLPAKEEQQGPNGTL